MVTAVNTKQARTTTRNFQNSIGYGRQNTGTAEGAGASKHDPDVDSSCKTWNMEQGQPEKTGGRPCNAR